MEEIRLISQMHVYKHLANIMCAYEVKLLLLMTMRLL